MVTRHTTLTGRTGARRYATGVRSGKVSNVQGRERTRVAKRNPLSAAQVGARLDAAERQVEDQFLRARSSAIKAARNSMHEVLVAAGVVRSSMKQALAAVRHAARRIAKQVAALGVIAPPPASTAKPAARTSSRRAAAV